jgi:hypothetical protein
MKKPDDTYLLSYRKNVYSQSGEDGVLAKIFSMLPKEKNRWTVEFGGWDGKFSSNTCNFIENSHWNGIFIEPDAERFKELVKNHGSNPNVHCIKKFITLKGENRIDRILQKVQNLPKNFDLLSVDVDSCDYQIWKSMNLYQPKVVIIEFNPSIPLDFDYIQPDDFSIHNESNLGVLVKLGKNKGYELVSCVENNAIFVRKEYFHLFKINDNSPEILFAPFKSRYQTQLWQGYDGTLHLIGCNKLLVHNILIREERIQVLPKILRFFPGQTHPILQTFKKAYYKFPFIPKLMNLVLTGASEGSKTFVNVL